MASIRVAVLGTGFGQAVHLPGLRRHPRTTVAALYHRDLAKAQALARQLEIPRACDSLGEILANPQIDAVTLATPPFLHYDQAKQALLAGKHILLEKPVCGRRRPGNFTTWPRNGA